MIKAEIYYQAKTLQNFLKSKINICKKIINVLE